ncbi:phosphoglycerate mutase [Lysobacter sp. D1-1-M9]|uniref:phosphoglycerate mutase n=1 Tax=Novilysobacter longmucuonensis TaxID=3098603 RepID=UPI002FC7E872
MATATLLLPARGRFGGQLLPEALGRRLGRADRRVGKGAQLARVFDLLPRGWPVAAATRQRDAGDAGQDAWLRADPAYVRPDINGARLLAHGDALSLTDEDTAAFLPALKPLFGDAGFPIDAPTPSRWYLRLPAGAKLPSFTSPADALGADLLDQLPGSGEQDSPEGRRWRALLSEAQVVLHNHSRNAQRAAEGLAPVNSVWFWGAGVLPDHVRTSFSEICSDDEAMRAFADLAGIASSPLPDAWQAGGGDRLIDLRHGRGLAVLDRDWMAPALRDLDVGALERLTLDFADGMRFEVAIRQRWRFWRRPVGTFDP